MNFVGAEDEFVASGSDDGNFFLWEKDTGKLHGIYEGDESVVNVIEQHPRLPLLACSGIDTTVKVCPETRSTFIAEQPPAFCPDGESFSILKDEQLSSNRRQQWKPEPKELLRDSWPGESL